MACSRSSFYRILFLPLALLVMPLLISFPSLADEGDPPDESFGGFGDSYDVIIDGYDFNPDGSYNVSLDLVVPYEHYTYPDDIMPLSTVDTTINFPSIPAGATVYGNIRVSFTGTMSFSSASIVDPGYVYFYSFTPPSSMASVSFTAPYTTNSAQVLTGAVSANINGFDIYEGVVGGVGAAGYIPNLGATMSGSMLQTYTVAYRITNSSNVARDASLKIISPQSSQLSLSKSASLASLYSADGSSSVVDILSKIRSDLRYDLYKNGKDVSPGTILAEFYYKMLDIRNGFGYKGSSSSDSLQYDLNAIKTQNDSIYNLIVDRMKTLFSKVDTMNTNITTQGESTRKSMSDFNKSVNDTLATQGTATRKSITDLQAALVASLTTINSTIKSFDDRLHDQIVSLTASLKSWFNRQHQDLVDLGDKLTRGYDSSAGNDAKVGLDSSMSGLNGAQDQAYKDASGTLDSYDIGGFFKFGDGLVSGLSFLTSVTESFLGASGDFSVALSTLFVLAFLSMLLGIWRFAR